jgi:predicted amidohydrolase
MKVAAYQAPLLACGSKEAINLIRDQVRSCESAGVEILCCPEGVLGGLADYASRPSDIAIDVEGGQLEAVLAPLASETVTTILGFTEIGQGGQLFNAAAVLHKGVVIGLYRKLYPAISRSIYESGSDTPVFKVGDLTFGIVICRDSTYPEPARIMADKGATALFVPTNNGLPPTRAGVEVVDQARNTDIARAIENSLAVVRADVAGRADGLVSYGSSGIVDRNGIVLHSARQLEAALVVADIEITPRRIGAPNGLCHHVAGARGSFGALAGLNRQRAS